ncbi:HAD-IA family hydrolase [Pannonibacter sp. Pt2-lr]
MDHMLKLHDLEGRFVTIQTADTSPSKPHPDMVLRAMGETGAEPLRTVMIGDTSFDMEMARAAGVSPSACPGAITRLTFCMGRGPMR